MDRKLEHQHQISTLPFGLVVIRARSSRMKDLQVLLGELREALARIQPGKVRYVSK